MNQCSGNDDRDVALKASTNAANEANKWTDFVPFMLSNTHNDAKFKLIDMFSMVHLPPREKESHFHPKCKRSDESAWKTLLKDLQREGYKHVTRLVSLGSQRGDSKRLVAYLDAELTPVRPKRPKH